MTRTHALYMLLRLGPLSYADLVEITGWPRRVVDGALCHACRPRGGVRRSWGGGWDGSWRLFFAKTEEEMRRAPARKRRCDAGKARRRRLAC